jgi:hypothetical protein
VLFIAFPLAEVALPILVLHGSSALELVVGEFPLEDALPLH